MNKIHTPESPVSCDIVDEIVSNWRARGFPHYDLPIAERVRDFDTFSKYDRSNMIENGIIKQTLHALGLVWHYFPHHWDVKVGKNRTAWDVWNNAESTQKTIQIVAPMLNKMLRVRRNGQPNLYVSAG